jgi:hypothetical protein
MKKLLFVLLFLDSILACAQGYTGDEHQQYRYAKIFLQNGKKLVVRNLLVSQDEISYMKVSPAPWPDVLIKYPNSQVKYISVADRSYALAGFLIGTAVGVGTMLIAKDLYYEEITRYPYTIKRTLPTIHGIGIVFSGALVGTVVGGSIRSGWKTIYPGHKTSLNNNIRLNLSLGYGCSNQIVPGVRVCCQF